MKIGYIIMKPIKYNNCQFKYIIIGYLYPNIVRIKNIIAWWLCYKQMNNNDTKINCLAIPHTKKKIIVEYYLNFYWNYYEV